MKKDSGDATDEAGGATGVRQREIRTCRACGTKFSVTNNNEFCPVCILRGAAGSESTLPEDNRFGIWLRTKLPRKQSMRLRLADLKIMK